MKRIFAPTMGTGLLIGLAMFAWGLLPSTGFQRAMEAEGSPEGAS
jgi:hypothetical protein